MTWKRDAILIVGGALAGWLLKAGKDEKPDVPDLVGQLDLTPEEDEDWFYVHQGSEMVGQMFPEADDWWARRYHEDHIVADSPSFTTKQAALEWLRGAGQR